MQESSFSYDVDTQSEINHDVLFREGLNNFVSILFVGSVWFKNLCRLKGLRFQKKVTFTPRLLLADLKGSLGCLTTSSDLYEDKSIPDLAEDVILWPTDKVQVDQAPPLEKNEFLSDIEKEDATIEDTETCE